MYFIYLIENKEYIIDSIKFYLDLIGYFIVD